MSPEDLLKVVRQIEIKARRLSDNRFAGEYHAVFKGKGMSFSEVREYQYGDDVRDIDWNVTARMGKPFVKVFEEERELVVFLLIDVSRSLDFGTQKVLKKQIVTEIAATLSFSAIKNNDRIGVIFFSDRIEKYIPPRSGRKHILYIIREMLNLKPTGTKTDIAQAVRFLMKIQHKQCTAFIISDFIVRQDLMNVLLMSSKKYDMNAIQVYDKIMETIPNIGLVQVCDLETGHEQLIDTSSKEVRKIHHLFWEKRQKSLVSTFNKCNIRNVAIRTDDDYVKSLTCLFSRKK